MNRRRPLLTVFSLLLFLSLAAQEDQRTVINRCGTMQYFENKLQQNASLRAKFEQRKFEFARIVSSRSQQRMARLGAPVSIPVVFHIVLPNPSIVSDAQIQAQIDTLNKDFFGTNGDSVRIPSYFKPLFGKSNIQFCLAERTPDGDPTTGIERITTTKPSFSINTDGVKHGYAGGVDSWNTDKYFNVWVCLLSGGVLGYSTFPDDPSTAPADEGVAMDYRSLPGGSFTAFNGGKTLTHETGHYFNLYHIWGDDDNLSNRCLGTDLVDDTPNQQDASTGILTGIKTDACTGGNGIMYQNYMDYTDDPCLVMFTSQQVDRMETALTTFRPSLLSSNGCQPVILNNYDAQLKLINQPPQRLCNTSFTPQVTFRNRGSQTLTSLQISTRIDNGSINTTSWTGSLATLGSVTVNLNSLTATQGVHTLTVFVSNPNNNTDQDKTNDTLRMSFQYFAPVSSVSESFEGITFPPAGWDIVNPGNDITWQRVSLASKTGNASVRMDNYNYSIDAIGQSDDLRMPSINIPAGVDSAFLSFQVAAAVVTDFNTPANNWDTLQVLISQDCGQTYSSLYKKWGKNLVTDTIPKGFEFIPSSTQWRKDSVNLINYIGASNLLIAFRNTTGAENEVYLDDVNIRTITVSSNLKEQGFIVAHDLGGQTATLQFYPQPSSLRAVQLFNDIGQKVFEVQFGAGQAYNNYPIDLWRYRSGMYIVRAIFNDRVLTRKIIKR